MQQILASGVCVASCPTLNTDLANVISTQLNPANWGAASENLTVYTYGQISRLTRETVNVTAKRYVTYSTVSLYNRCVPGGIQPSQNSNSSYGAIPGGAEVQTFFYRGIIEVANSWRVFLIVFFVALVMCFIYTSMMRLFIGVLVWTVIAAVFVALLIVGYAAYSRYVVLNQANTTDNSSDAQYVRFYQAAAVIAWVGAFCYIIAVIFLRKRIVMACAIIKVAGRVMTSAPGMIFVPIIITLLVIGVIAWCIGVAVYIYTSEDFSKVPTLLNESYCSGSSNGGCYGKFNSTVLSTDKARRNLLFYDLFGFLWTMGFFNAIGYVIISFISVFWYFSSMVDSEKAVPSGSFFRATSWTLVYHLGTISFGSLIIAIIQFVRILMNYFAMKAKGLKENDVVKCVLCIANCCLACFERIVSVISKNAYILMCITSDNFFMSALTATDYILENVATIAILEVIAELVCLVGKLFIVFGSVLLGYILMNSPKLAPGVETRILPLLIIAFGAYFIASIFFNVYGTAVDTMLMCFCHDRKKNETSSVKYVPAELASQIEGYSVPTSQQEAYAKNQAAQHAP